MPQKDFPGTGIERVIDHESLETVISLIKKLELGEPIQPANSIYLKTEIEGNLEVIVSFLPLNEPQGTFLMLAKPNE